MRVTDALRGDIDVRVGPHGNDRVWMAENLVEQVHADRNVIRLVAHDGFNVASVEDDGNPADTNTKELGFGDEMKARVAVEDKLEGHIFSPFCLRVEAGVVSVW